MKWGVAIILLIVLAVFGFLGGFYLDRPYRAFWFLFCSVFFFCAFLWAKNYETR